MILILNLSWFISKISSKIWQKTYMQGQFELPPPTCLLFLGGEIWRSQRNWLQNNMIKTSMNNISNFQICVFFCLNYSFKGSQK